MALYHQTTGGEAALARKRRNDTIVARMSSRGDAQVGYVTHANGDDVLALPDGDR